MSTRLKWKRVEMIWTEDDVIRPKSDGVTGLPNGMGLVAVVPGRGRFLIFRSVVEEGAKFCLFQLENSEAGIFMVRESRDRFEDIDHRITFESEPKAQAAADHYMATGRNGFR